MIANRIAAAQNMYCGQEGMVEAGTGAVMARLAVFAMVCSAIKGKAGGKNVLKEVKIPPMKLKMNSPSTSKMVVSCGSITALPFLVRE